MIFLYMDAIGFIELVQSSGSDNTVVQAARVSFINYEEFKEFEPELSSRDKRLINYLAENNHTSPFEHNSITFRIKVPLFVRSQIMRHRTFSYNEVSRRYTSEKIEIWEPRRLRSQSDTALQCSDGDLDDELALEAYRESVAQSLKAYCKLIERGVARELARCVLPESTYTTFYMTGNLHNWIKFLKLRLDSHAQPETQVVASLIKEQLEELFPVSMNAFLNRN